MIGVTWRDGHVDWISPDVILIDGGEDRVRRVLSRPVVTVEREEGPDREIVEVEKRLKPGDGIRHVRAALRSLPDAVVLVDDGDG